MNAMYGLVMLCFTLQEAPTDDLSKALAHPILPPSQTLGEVQQFIEARLPTMPDVKTSAEWASKATEMRSQVLEKVLFRGEASSWRDAPSRVDWLGQIDGGPGYIIKKLRFEVVPGFWIPALLYEPTAMSGKIPVILNVNGHDAKGKAADYKQVRCINFAKKGILALSLEWIGMGQLGGKENDHGLINSLDLCGTSGIALHYLAMTRGIDILLQQDHADPGRVGVTGLSGGGWQTIFVSALDERVSLSNPVAGYSSFRTRIRHFSDLGDSEQTPCDLATIVDYDHLTAMRAPRATLLTFNAKDNCCFAAPHALPPLLQAAGPIFALFDVPGQLRSHINHEPGDHNYLLDNRTAFYRMLSDQWSRLDQVYNPAEIPCESEVKTAEQLAVELPSDTLTIASLARQVASSLPRENRDSPEEKVARLRSIVKPILGEVHLEAGSKSVVDGIQVVRSRAKIGLDWSVPVVEMSRGEAQGTTILIGDQGRAELAERARALIENGQTVLAMDLYGFGEATTPSHGYLFALTVGTVGERPLGIASGQLLAIAQFLGERDGKAPKVEAVGPRSSLIAMVSAAMDDQDVGGLTLRDPMASLKDVIDEARPFAKSPEVFCFGLLESYDIQTLAGMVAPRPLLLENASERARRLISPR